MQQGVQTDATCNIQQCWELLVNNVASVCTQLFLSSLFQYVLLLLFCLAVVYASVCRPNLIRLVIPPFFLFLYLGCTPVSSFASKLERLKLARLLDRCDWEGKLPSCTGPLSLLSSLPLSLLS